MNFKGFPNCCTAYILEFNEELHKTAAHQEELLNLLFKSSEYQRAWKAQISNVAYVVATTGHREKSKNTLLKRFGFTHMDSSLTEHFWWVYAPDFVKTAEKLNEAT